MARRLDWSTLAERAQASFPGRCVTSFIWLRGLDRAMVIASQAFTALIPLLMVLSAFLPRGSDTAVSDAVIRRFALTGDAAVSVAEVFEPSQSSSVGIASMLLLLFSGVSLTRRLQKMYLSAWQVPPRRGVRGSLNAVMGLLALLLEFTVLYLFLSVIRNLPFDRALQLPLSWAASAVLWTTIPWLLVDRQVGWRRLAVGGALTATCATLYGVATTIYMPPLMESYSVRYGLFGVTIALVGWLLCVSVLVVASSVVAAELDRAPERWAQRFREAVGILEREPAPSRREEHLSDAADV